MSRSRAFLLVLLVVLAGTSADARPDTRLRWRVEPQDFVHYRILEETVDDSDAREGFARAHATDLEGFYGYELDEAGRSVVRPVTQEAWLAVPFVFRLPGPKRKRRGREALDEEVAGTWRLGPVRARGHLGVEVVGKRGEAERVVMNGLVLFEPDPGPDLSRHPYAYRRLTRGRLTWTSIFDVERGLMTRVVYDLQVRTSPTPLALPRGVHDLRPGERALEVHRVLELDRLYAYRFSGFQGKVDVAIERCCDWLEALLSAHGSPFASVSHGQTALALLALVRSGRSVERAALKRGFAWLLEQEPKRTYEVGAVLMALEALGTPPEEMMRARRGELAAPLPRTLSPKARAYVQRCADTLIGNVQEARPAGEKGPVTGRGRLLRWGYAFDYRSNPEPGQPDRWDNSNTQYAVLGLNSAARCGVEVPRSLWRGIAEHYLAMQAPDGEERKRLRLTPHEKPGPVKGRRYGVDRVDAVRRGWSYGECPRGCRPYGSMTCAGVASLAIARSHLTGGRRSRHRASLSSRIDVAIRDGWAVLEGMWTVFENPRYEGWYLYHLYGLERAGVLCDVERLEEHDWYWEGALQLLLRQEEDGSWPVFSADPTDTIWALLFLSRSTTPITPR